MTDASYRPDSDRRYDLLDNEPAVHHLYLVGLVPVARTRDLMVTK